MTILQAVCLFVSLFISVLQCQVLDFTGQPTPVGVYCGHLRCVTNGSLSIISVSIYDLTGTENRVKLASISVFTPEVSVDPSKIHVVNATGTILKNAGVLDVRFLREVDCLNGTFQCELGFINIKGQPDVIRENLKPAAEENATILYSLAKITSQLVAHSQETEKRLKALKNDNQVLKNGTEFLKHNTEVLKNDTEVLKNDNKAVKTVLDNVLVELSRIKEFLNSTLDKDEQPGTFCYRGMTHKSPREKFLLQGKTLALCDTETDGGGWVVIQRRSRGDVDFYRGWDDYKKGFGTLDTDFWIGNDLIHNLSSQGYYQLRIDFVHNKTEFFAQYTNFNLADETSKYIITTNGYSGNLFDFMRIHNGDKFSTFDRDNDLAVVSCAVDHHGAWWYNNCYNSNLNGNWTATDSSGIYLFFNSTAHWSHISFTEMKIRHI